MYCTYLRLGSVWEVAASAADAAGAVAADSPADTCDAPTAAAGATGTPAGAGPCTGSRIPSPCSSTEATRDRKCWDCLRHTARVRHVSYATSDPRTAHSPVRRMSWFLGRGSRRRRCSEGRGFESCPQGMNIIRSCAIAAGGERTGRPYVFNRKRGGRKNLISTLGS